MEDKKQFAVIKDAKNIPSHLRGCVLAVGNFDGVHIGHQYLLKKAIISAQKQKIPALVLTFEPHPANFNNSSYKIERLTNPLQKYKILRYLGFDGVVEQKFDQNLRSLQPAQFVKQILCEQLNIKKVVVGYDFHFGNMRSGNSEILKEFGKIYNFEVEVVEAQKTSDCAVISSSRIRQMLAQGKMEEAAKLLNYHYFVEQIVIDGAKLGRKIGYPTANMEIDQRLLPFGVYAVKFKRRNGQVLDGVASYGCRPTVVDQGRPLLETYLFDFSQDIYGENSQVSFFAFLRPEQKFDKLENMILQIENDVKQAKSILKEAHELSKLDKKLCF